MKKFIYLTFVLLMGAQMAFATNGYFSHGYGIRYKGMAGVGVSLYHSSLGSALNPSSLVYVGNKYDVSIALFSPNRQFTVMGAPSPPPAFGLNPVTTESDNNFFIIPSLGANWMLNDQSSIGVAIYGNGGMNTEYPAAIFGGASPTGINLSQLFINASYSRKLGENHSIGVSAIFAVQFFEATGLEAFGGFSSDATKITGTGKDSGTGFGFKVGYQGELAEGFRLGVSYQSKIATSEFSDYAGLFAEQGGFDIPATWTAGFSYDIGGNFIAAVDVQQVLYSKVPSIANPVSNLFLGDGSGALGGDNGAGFGWRDMTVLKIGGEYHGMESTKLRAGVSFALDDQPIPESEMIFNILAPGVMKTHVTLGLSQAIGEKNEINFAAMYAPSNSISGPNPFDPAQTIELKMNQWEFEVGFSF